MEKVNFKSDSELEQNEFESISMTDYRPKWWWNYLLKAKSRIQRKINRLIDKFCYEQFERGFKIKVDTNGFFPQILSKCMPYIDYVALDVKTSPSKMRLLGAKNIDDYLYTVKMLKKNLIDYEFRTTIVPHFVNKEDLPEISKLVRGAKRFALQQFVAGDTLSKSFNEVIPYTAKKIHYFQEILERTLENTELIVRNL